MTGSATVSASPSPLRPALECGVMCGVKRKKRKQLQPEGCNYLMTKPFALVTVASPV